MKSKKNANNAGSYVLLEGSHKAAPLAAVIDTLNPNEVMSVTVRVRRKKSIDALLKAGKQITHEEYEKNHGAIPAELAAVEEYAQLHHLSIVESSAARRSVVLTGAVKNFESAFQVHLSHHRSADGHIFRGRSGGIHIPGHLEGVIEGVFGLDNRPQATPKSQVLHTNGMFTSHAAAPGSFSPDQLAKI